MLDEPAAGLAHAGAEALGHLLVVVRTELGASVLVVKPHCALVAAVCGRVCRLRAGRVVAARSPVEVIDANDSVLTAWVAE